MRERNWSPATLARRMGYSAEDNGAGRSRVSRMLSGDRGITPETLDRLAEAFDVTPYVLRREAGLLSEDELRSLRTRTPMRDYLASDPLLNDRGRDAVLRVYELAVRGAAASAGRSTKSSSSP